MNRKRLYDYTTVFIHFFGLAFLISTFLSCSGSNVKTGKTKIQYSTLEFEHKTEDKTEYDIIISDVGYDSFLSMQKQPNFYTQSYYENWNRYYVNDWNQKVAMSQYHTSKYNNVFDMYINYDSTINYGMEVNYKLYYYFIFVEKQYGVKFNVPRAINY